jgi:hypothetical protein
LVYSLTFLYQLYDWISSNLQYISVCIDFLPGILNLGFIRCMDIGGYIGISIQSLVYRMIAKGFSKLMSFKLILTFIAHIESFDY